ncbi:ribosomal protein L1p/L10e family-domain-containing protein [Melampsora americana]|nr:ribosomal protein L1p/L10e family-domain-containing protein [Melampsora americana]
MFADDVGTNDRFLSLVITLKRIPNKDKHKPIRLALDHPLLDPKSTPVCLIVKDPQSEYKALLEERNIKFISKVVGIEKLKGKHGAFEARRQLLNSHGLFLADARVIPMLPKLLGSKFFQSKKLPVPVNITEPKKVKAELEQAISSTYLRLSMGTCIVIKFADLSRHNESEVKENLQKVIDQVGKRIPLGGWTNVQGLHIKTGTSTSLPVWLAELNSDQFGRFGLDPSEEEVEAKKGAEEKKRQLIEEKSQRKKRRLSTVSVESVDSE